MRPMLLNISTARFSAKAVLSRRAKREPETMMQKWDAGEHPQNQHSKAQQSSALTEISTHV